MRKETLSAKGWSDSGDQRAAVEGVLKMSGKGHIFIFRCANVCQYVLVINRGYLMRPRQVTTSLFASSGSFSPRARYLGGVA